MIDKIKRLFKSNGVDKGLYACIALLAVFGIIMIGSASVGQAAKEGSTFATKNMLKQAFFVFCGYLAMRFFARTFKVRWLKENFTSIIYFIVLSMMLICILWTVNNSHAWIIIGPASIQPVEFMKVTLICTLAFRFGELPRQYTITRRISKKARKKIEDKKIKECVIVPFAMIIVAFIVCAGVQKDLGSALILGLISLMLFLSAPSRYFSKIKKMTIVGIVLIIILFILFGGSLAPHQMQRFVSWLNPLSDPYDTTYQIVNGLIAFTNGGLLGLGFGNSIQKFGYIPEAQNDYIFAIVVEELGMIGVALVFIPYCIIIFKLFKYAFKMTRPIDRLILIGVGAYFFMHLFVNVGGVSGLIPMTGVPLLLISAGGSSTLTAMISIGIAQAIIARYNRETLQGQLES